MLIYVKQILIKDEEEEKKSATAEAVSRHAGLASHAKLGIDETSQKLLSNDFFFFFAKHGINPSERHCG